MAVAGVVSLVGGGAGALLGLLLTIVVGRWLGGADAGYFFQLVALFMIACNVLELGADTGLVRQISRLLSLRRLADLRRTVAVALVPVLVIGALAVGSLLLFAPALGRLLSGADGAGGAATMAALIAHAAPLVLPAALVTVLLGGTRGFGTVVPFATVYNVGIPAARVLGVGGALLAGLGLVAASWTWAWTFLPAAVVAAAILARLLSRRPDTPGGGMPPTATRALAREFWGFSAPRGAAAGVEIALTWLDVLLVGALVGPTAAGVYAVAMRCAQSGMLAETAMRMAVSPRISAALATGDTTTARGLHFLGTRSMVLLGWPLFLTLAIFGDVVLPLFGEGFVSGTSTLVVLCLAMLTVTGAGMVQSVLLMGGRSRVQLGNKAVALGVNLAADLALIPVLGALGAAVGWLLTVAVDAALASWQVRRMLAIRAAARELLPAIVLVTVAVAVPGVVLRFAFGATPVILAVDVVVALALLLAACWRFRRVLGLADVLATARARASARAPAREERTYQEGHR